ncbi:MAG TPA: glycosyltransferase family 1 protein [candidate division Zixibacteria bacterium]|nr:glycosyltransferase family 1 protein [candidate division Zixibacteria bacterium]HER00546.1 glycosyltransferase family 1 protein [candidate division Zixibacteria bacterium]
MPSEENKTKIALCDLGRSFRGGQRQTLNLARTLQYNGHEVLVICHRNGELLKHCELNGIDVIASKYSILSLLLEGHRIYRELKKIEAQIFHASDSHSHSLGLIVKRFNPSLKMVVTVRTAFDKSTSVSKRLKYNSPRVNAYVAISKAVFDVLLKKGIAPSKIKVIPSSVDYAVFNPGDRVESKVFRIGTAGALEKDKGVDLILLALAKINSELGDYVFKVAGEGPYRESLGLQAGKLGLSDKVRFLGFVNDMPDFYSNLDLFILASKSEGLGSSLLEAGACGAVIAGAEIPGIQEIITDNENGFLFERHELNRLSDIILNLSGDHELGNKIRKEFYNNLRKFDINNITGQYLNLYRKLLENN